MSSIFTISLSGKLDENVTGIEQIPKYIPKNTSNIAFSINSGGGTLEAANKIGLVFKSLQKKYLVTVEAIDIRSSAIYLFLFFEKENRIISEKAVGKIHLPEETFKGSNAKESAIKLLTDRTLLSRDEVINLEGKILYGKEMVNYGFGFSKIN
jgi:ATP-dependent protease ClpP protease subunit